MDVNPTFFGFPPRNTESIWLEDDGAITKVCSPDDRFSSGSLWSLKPLNYDREDTCTVAPKLGSDSLNEKPSLKRDIVDEPVVEGQSFAEHKSPDAKDTKDVMSAQSDAMETK